MSRIFAGLQEERWLFGRATDLWVFGGSTLASMLLLALGAALGILDGDAPVWIWLGCIVAVDVAHVWSTAFRVYLDPAEVRRRPWLYLGLPLCCYGLGVLLHALSAALFWRVLAYVAVFHFIRQQYGWVALYRRRAAERGGLDRVLDSSAIYLATLFPLLHWHAHLPRGFHWFMQGDFIEGVALDMLPLAEALYWGVLGAFAARQLQLLVSGRRPNWGKLLVVSTTALCWYVGIVALASDYAFTVTNVLIHGVPYMALTYRYGRSRGEQLDSGALRWLPKLGVMGFLSLLLGTALMEEALWDRWIWHDHSWLFGEGGPLGASALSLLVPLLALPQATHYALDGFIWRVRGPNPLLARELQAR